MSALLYPRLLWLDEQRSLPQHVVKGNTIS